MRVAETDVLKHHGMGAENGCRVGILIRVRTRDSGTEQHGGGSEGN
jgi:hypothetical protein